MVYENERLENTFLLREAENLQRGALISKDQLRSVESQLPGYHAQHHPLARAGLFLLGLFLFSACCLAIVVFTESLDWNNAKYFSLFFAISGMLILEILLIKRFRYYGNGIDDAFVFSSLFCLLAFVGFALNNHIDDAYLYLIAAMVAAFFCLRYIDSLSVIIAIAALFISVFYFIEGFGSSSFSVMPFVFMTLSAVLWVLQIKLAHARKGKTKYFKNPLQTMGVMCALLFYFSGNYFIVRENYNTLYHWDPVPGTNIPSAYFYHAFTICCPAVYLALGLKKRNRHLLWVSFFCVGFSVFTIRHYHAILPLETAMLGGGAIIFSLSWWAMRCFRDRPSGPVYSTKDNDLTQEALLVQAVVLSGHQTNKGAETISSAADEGEGEFGGAGSGAKY